MNAALSESLLALSKDMTPALREFVPALFRVNAQMLAALQLTKTVLENGDMNENTLKYALDRVNAAIKAEGKL